jgi:hypothetical protein
MDTSPGLATRGLQKESPGTFGTSATAKTNAGGHREHCAPSQTVSSGVYLTEGLRPRSHPSLQITYIVSILPW